MMMEKGKMTVKFQKEESTTGVSSKDTLMTHLLHVLFRTPNILAWFN
jgi:hypothetical protein